MLRTTGIAAALAGLLIGTSAVAQAAPWTVSEASGQVVVRDASGDHAATRGTAVAPGATILTGAGGRAVIVRGHDFVTMNANARMRIPAAVAKPGLFQLIQEWGNAVFRIEHRPDPHFGVQAPYLAAVVKGTTFSITVAREGSSLQVIEGAVEAATSDGGAHELVRPGVVASVMAADRFRLSVHGQGAHVLDSPQRTGDAAPGKRATSGSGEAPAVTIRGRVAGDDAIKWGDVSASMISAPIEAKPADLGKLTGGLVGGDNGAGMAVASAVVSAHADGASHNGNSTRAGNGNGADGTGSGNSGNGNGGDGSAIAGAGGGNGNADAGNGGGNPGSGNGTGNADNGNGSGSGNGTGNSSGSGNGNPGTGNGGGNGNGNTGTGNGGGNGNGNTGTGNGGGNGNGNPGTGNGGGNGNGNPGTGNGGGNPGNGKPDTGAGHGKD